MCVCVPVSVSGSVSTKTTVLFSCSCGDERASRDIVFLSLGITVLLRVVVGLTPTALEVDAVRVRAFVGDRR